MPEVTVAGRRVAYLEQGTGAPVVLLHAGGSSSKQWAKTAALLETGFRVVAPDLWGFGGTDAWSGDEALSHDHQALLVARVLEAAAAAPAHVVGHSYGGATAVRLALHRSGLVRSLVLIEPILITLLNGAGDEAVFREWDDMAQTFLSHAAAGRPAEAWQAFLDYRNGAGTWAALSPASRERFLAGTASTAAGFRSNLDNPTSLGDFRGLAHPMLVLCGEKTSEPDRRVTAILAKTIPECRFAIIPGAEHMSPLSHPDFIARAITNHIETTDKERPR